MGWDGQCDIEELVDGDWCVLDTVDVQYFVYRVSGSLHTSFVKNEPSVKSRDEPFEEPLDECDQDYGEFLWADYRAASGEELDCGHLKSFDEIIERFLVQGQFELAEALQDSSRTIRISCDISM